MDKYTGQETCAQIVHWEDEFYKADEVDAEIAELVEMLQTAFTQGYEAGHHDTVESGYTDASDVYEDWIEDWISEGNTELVNIDLINKYKKEG